MRDLIERLEKATDGSMDLSRQVARARGWINVGNSKKGEWYRPEDTRDGKPVLDGLHGTDFFREPPDFTTSLDAALTLVPEGYAIEDMMIWPASPASVTVLETKMGRDGRYWRGHTRFETVVGRWDATAKTAPLALCVAALRARLSEKEPADGR